MDRPRPLARLASAAALAAALGVAGLASPAHAQDHYDQMVNKVQQRKARSLEQVMTAPAKVQDSIRHTEVDIGMQDQPKVEHVANPLDDGGNGLTTTEVVCIAIGLAVLGGFLLTRKLATRV